MTTTMRKAYIVVVGVAARCRKVDRHMVKLPYAPETVSPEELARIEADAREQIKRFRNVQRAVLHLDVVERETRESSFGMTYETETWSPFDNRHMRVVLA